MNVVTEASAWDKLLKRAKTSGGHSIKSIERDTARVRRAWAEALEQREVDQEAQKRARKRAAVEDIDQMLDAPVLDGFHKRFWQRHKIKLQPDRAPSDQLVSRLRNEPDRREPSIKDVWTVKTQAWQRLKKRKKERLGEWEMSKDEEEYDSVAPVQDIPTFLHLLWVLLLGYAVAGCKELTPPTGAPAREEWGSEFSSTSYIEIPMDVLLLYWWRVEKATKLLHGRDALEVIERRDRSERTQWAEDFRNSNRTFGACVAAVYARREAVWEPLDAIRAGESEATAPPLPRARTPPRAKTPPRDRPTPAKDRGKANQKVLTYDQKKTATALQNGQKLCAAFSRGKCT